MSVMHWLGALTAMFLLAGGARAEEVVRVTDGDSLVVDSGGREVEVRLADIDAPELAQPHGERARAALSALIGGGSARLELVSGDAYRRIVARVFVRESFHFSWNERDVAEALVRDGHAWVRRAYAPQSDLIALEEEARAAKRGLWAEADPVPPWIWRKFGSASPRGEGGETAPLPNVQCGTKRYCREMTSCEEAIAYLRQCNLERLDGDGDGIPCEKLCRYYR